MSKKKVDRKSGGQKQKRRLLRAGSGESDARRAGPEELSRRDQEIQLLRTAFGLRLSGVRQKRLRQRRPARACEADAGPADLSFKRRRRGDRSGIRAGRGGDFREFG